MSLSTTSAPATPPTAVEGVHRFEVFARTGHADPVSAAVTRDALQLLGIKAPLLSVHAKHVYLVQGALSAGQRGWIAEALLADAITEQGVVGTSAIPGGSRVVEVHPLPGVMDPVALSVELAIREGIGQRVRVMTGWRYDITGADAEQVQTLAGKLLANPVIQRVSFEPYTPGAFPVGQGHDQVVRSVPVTTLGDEELVRLSRDAHLFLSLEEMRAIRGHYQALGREPRDIELETLAQTWSEHCVHKTLKSAVHYAGPPGDAVALRTRPGTTAKPDGSAVIDNLLKRTVAAATHELIAEGVDWTLSVFKDNSGVIALDENLGVCIKVETHNRPSAIEPYGGAATGAGGCIRDVIGTGLGARPIANTDVFCVADPSGFAPGDLPPGTLHPRRVLTQVVAGVRDYGNRMGIPTVSGAVSFDDRYIGNPLVFCGCVGLIPRHLVHGQARAGDRIIALGGRTGRDGVHGATFSSAQLEQNAADEFGHAVQIGNAITEKQVLDAILRARDARPAHAGGPLYTGMTDCGAGGFSSAIGEMGAKLGAEVHLENAPLKYAGLSYTEIWISEAQERMVLAVPPRDIEALRAICEQEGVEMADLGHFGTEKAELVLKFHGSEVGRLSMHLLHEGIPMPTREARWAAPVAKATPAGTPAPHVKDALLALLATPTIASKHWIIRQYDHEVQGMGVIKPLVGPGMRGPSDASVLEPVPGTGLGIAIGCGLQTPIGDPALGGDPYQMALAAIDECVRNLVCVGADPARSAILDNFSWPSCNKPENMGALVRACWGCYDGAKAYRTPFVSGKDSLNNQLQYTDPATGAVRVIEVPFTLLVTGLGIVHDLAHAITMDAKAPGNSLLLVGQTPETLGGTHYQLKFGPSLAPGMRAIPQTDLARGPVCARAVSSVIRAGLVRSAHDVSDGGLLCCISEMLIAGSTAGAPIGARVDLTAAHRDPLLAAFAEGSSRYVLEVAPQHEAGVLGKLDEAGVPCVRIGQLDASGVLTDLSGVLSVVVNDLAGAWLAPLDW